MTDTTATTPTDVFTRVLTDNIGRKVSISDTQGGNKLATVEAVEAGVLTLVEDLSAIFGEDAPTQSRTYIRIDHIASVNPMS